MTRILQRALLIATAGICTGAGLAPVAALAQGQSYQLDIPQQALGDALRSLGKATRQTVVFNGAAVRGKRSMAVKGGYTMRQALDRMLDGSGLSVEIGRGGVIMVKPVVRISSAVRPDRDPPALEEDDQGRTGSAAIDGAAGDIVVTGTRIAGAPSASPVYMLDRAQINRTGYTSLEQILAAVPQNFGSLNASGNYGVVSNNPIDGQNDRRATAIDLRGLGPQSTLTLVNGTRRAGAVGGRAVDISVIPLGAIERIEIVTGGKSAIYGSDAVAGVANLITRRSFDGFESQVQFSGSEHGGERLQASQVAGVTGSNGGFIIAYDFLRQWDLNLVDTGAIINPLRTGATAIRRDIQPSGRRHSAMASGHVDLGGVELYGDVAYNRGRQAYFNTIDRYPAATRDSYTSNRFLTEGWDALGGARVTLSDRWSADISANFSRVSDDRTLTFFLNRGALVLGPIVTKSHESTEILGGSAVVSGTLPAVVGIEAKLAAGVQYREERVAGQDPGLGTPLRSNRSIRSAFAELYVPLVEDGGAGLRTLAVSMALRLDDYSDVGSTTNPQFGLIWEPFSELSVKGAYSTSFRAPSLIEFGAANYAELAYVSDPRAGGAEVPVLVWYLANADLRPERATTWTGSIDYKPGWAPGATFGAAYYNIRYKGRISAPALGVDSTLFLQRADRFPDLIDRLPSAQAVNAIVASSPDGVFDTMTGDVYSTGTDLLALFPGLITFDNRTANVAVETVGGLDLSAQFERDLGRAIIRAGAVASITLDHSRRVTATSPAISLLNETGKPVDFRARGTVSVERGAVSGAVFVNYVDGYRNPLSTVRPALKAWTTVDASVALAGAAIGVKGLDLSLSVQNLFDRKPPLLLGNAQGVAYDPANANPSGRNFAIRARAAF